MVSMFTRNISDIIIIVENPPNIIMILNVFNLASLNDIIISPANFLNRK
jgi:hypothetical protein